MPADGIGVVENAVISPSANNVAIKCDSYELYNDARNGKMLSTILGWYLILFFFFFSKRINPQNFESSVTRIPVCKSLALRNFSFL